MNKTLLYGGQIAIQDSHQHDRNNHTHGHLSMGQSMGLGIVWWDREVLGVGSVHNDIVLEVLSKSE